MIDFDKYLIPAEEAVITTKDNNVENAIKKLYEYMKDKGMTVVSKNHPSVKEYYSDVKFDKEINYKGSFFGIESNPSIQGLTDYKINFIIVPKNNKKDTPYPDSWTISEVNQKLNNYSSAMESSTPLITSINLYGKKFDLEVVHNDCGDPTKIENYENIINTFKSKLPQLLKQCEKKVVEAANKYCREIGEPCDHKSYKDLDIRPRYIQIRTGHNNERNIVKYISLDGSSSVIDAEHGFGIGFKFPSMTYVGLNAGSLEDWNYIDSQN